MSEYNKAMRQVPRDILKFLDNSAQWWEERAERLPTNQRIVEAINPLTAMGSAMGGMRAAARSGDKTGMALNALASIPLFGWMKAGQAANPLLKGAQARAIPETEGLRAWKSNVAASTADNTYDNGYTGRY